MPVSNIRAATGEEVRFEFDTLLERELNGVAPDKPYRNFSVESDFYTDTLKVSVAIPGSRELPKKVFVKIINIGEIVKESRVAAMDCGGRFLEAGLERVVVMHADIARPRAGRSYVQKVGVTLGFENRYEPLTCPINGTRVFNVNLFEAYEAQKGRLSSFGAIHPYPGNYTLPEDYHFFRGRYRDPDEYHDSEDVTVTELDVSIPAHLAGKWHNPSTQATVTIAPDGSLSSTGYRGYVLPPSALGPDSGSVVFGLSKNLWHFQQKTKGEFSYSIKDGKLTIEKCSLFLYSTYAFPLGEYEKSGNKGKKEK